MNLQKGIWAPKDFSDFGAGGQGFGEYVRQNVKSHYGFSNR